MMKRLLFIFFFLLSFSTANASHMMGGDITYECISPGKYKLTVKIYRDCRGIPFNNPLMSAFCADGGNISNSVNINYTRTAIKDITPICLNGTGPCNPQNTSSSEGIEEHTFEAIVDFNTSPFKAIKDAGCCEVKIKVEQQARNGAITNINAGNFYTDAMINICNVGTKCNTSPQLSIPPVAYLCCNQPFTYNNGVREVIDGDSLSYDLVNPLNANGSNETYQGSFSAQIPMTPFCPPVPGSINCRPLPNAKPPRGWYFDKETGDIVFTPTKCDEVGVVVIQVTEWRRDSATRKWLKIGYTKRDMQLIVKKCPDNNPPYFGIKNKYSVCEGNKICFTILAKDDPFLPNQLVPDTVQLTWNFGIPGGTFTIVDPTAREKEALFCWQTKIGDYRPNAYSFTATAKDNNCSNPSQANKGYLVTVNPKARDTRKYDILNCGWLKFNAIPFDTVNYNQKNYRYKYVIRDSTNSGIPYYSGFKKQDSLKFKRGGKYIIEHEISNPPYNCPTIYTDTIIIPPILDVELAFGKDTFMCDGDSLIIKPLISYGVPTYKYDWTISPALPSVTVLPDNSINLKRRVSSIIYLKLTDKNKCIDYDTIKVKLVPLPIVNIGPDQRICTYESVMLDAGHKDTMMYEWNTTDIYRTVPVNVAGKYSVKVSDSVYRCFSRDTMQLFVNDTVIANANPDREICIFDTLKLKGSRSPKGYSKVITWKDNSGILSNDSVYTTKIITSTPKQYEYYVKITQGGVTCEDKDTINVLVNLLPTFNYKGIAPRCYAEGAINLTTNGVATALSGDKTQTEPIIRYFQNKKPSWITGGPVKVNTFKYDYPSFITNAQVPKTGLRDSICYDYTDYKGCYNKECKLIRLNTNPVVDIVNKTHCQQAGLLTLDNLVKLPSSKIGGIQTFKCIDGPRLDVITQGNTIPVTYLFDPGTESETDRTGDYLIEYCFQDAITGCKTCDTSKVTIVKLPEILFESLPLLCVTDSLLPLDSFALDANTRQRFDGEWKTIEFSYSRTPSDKITKSVVNKKYFNPSYGPGVFMVKLSDMSSGCLAEDSIELIVNGLPIIRFDNPDTLCSSNPPLTLNNTQPTGKVGVWSGNGVTGRDFNPSITPKTKQYEGFYKVKFEYTNPNTGCYNFAFDSFVIQSQPELLINTPKPYQQCEGNIFNLSSNKKWVSKTIWTSNGDGRFGDSSKLNTTYSHGLQDTINNNVLLTVATIKEGVCPIAKDDIQLIIEPYPQFDFIGNPLIQCEPGVVDFTSVVRKPLSNLKYNWDFGNGTTSTQSSPLNVKYDTANRNWYDVVLTITNDWGNGQCVTKLPKLDYVKILPQPIAGFYTEPNDFTTVSFPKFKFVNQTKIRWGDDSVKYLWNFDIKNPDDTSSKKSLLKIYPNDTATYITQLRSSFTYQDVTCYDSVVKILKIGPNVTVFVPTVFSPERTGPTTNNVFNAVVNNEKTFHIEVLNRWGEMLWKSDNKFDSWDGTYKGQNCQQDVYVWVIKVTDYDGELYQYEGTITLLR
jgi:gliding motility-associated-like protein